MNEEAFKDSYKLFLAQGYNGTTEEYKDLISTNPEAFKDAYRFFSDDGYNGDENEFSLLIGVQPGKKDVVVEEDVVTATEESSASGVGPLALEEEDDKDKFDPKVQLKINLEPKIEPDVPEIIVDPSTVSPEQKRQLAIDRELDPEKQFSEIALINNEFFEAQDSLSSYAKKANTAQASIDALNFAAETNPESVDDAMREEYNKELKILNENAEKYNDLNARYDNNIAEWRESNISTVPGREEILGDTKRTTPGQLQSFDERIAKLTEEIDNLPIPRATFRPAGMADIADPLDSPERSNLKSQIKTIEKLKADLIKKNTDIDFYEAGSEYYINDKAVPRSEMDKFLGSNKYEDILNGKGSVKLDIKNDEYLQAINDQQIEAAATGEYIRSARASAAGFYDVFAKATKVKAAEALDIFLDAEQVSDVLGAFEAAPIAGAPIVTLSAKNAYATAKKESEETGEDVDDVFLRSYYDELNKTSEAIRGPQLYKTEDVIDRLANGDVTGFINGATKLGFESASYFAAAAVPVAGKYIVANALQTNTYYDLRKEGVSKGRAAAASGMVGAIGLADSFQFSKMLKGSLGSVNKTISAATKQGIRIDPGVKRQLGKNAINAVVVEPSTEFVQGSSESLVDDWAKGKELNFTKAARQGAIEASASLPTSATFATIPGAQYLYLKNNELKNINRINKTVENLLSQANADQPGFDSKNVKEQINLLTEEFINTFETAETTATKATASENKLIINLTAQEAVIEKALESRGNNKETTENLESKLDKISDEKSKLLDKIDSREIFKGEFKKPALNRNSIIVIDGDIPEALNKIKPSSKRSIVANGEETTRNVFLGADLIDGGVAEQANNRATINKLIKQRKKAEARIKSGKIKDELIPSMREEIQIINEEINNLGGFEETLETVEELTEGLEDTEVKSFQTGKEVRSYFESLIKEGKVQPFEEEVKEEMMQSLEKGQGLFLGLSDGTSVIMINKDASAVAEDVNIAAHEFLHALLAKSFTKENQSTELGKKLFKFLYDSNPEQMKTSKLGKRISQYVTDKKTNEEVGPEGWDAIADKILTSDNFNVEWEEILTLTSDALAEGTFNINESTLTKIGNILREILQKMGVKIKFDTGKDVLNFVRDYNKSIKKGKLTKSQKKLAGIKKPKGKDKIKLSKALTPAQESEINKIDKQIQDIIDKVNRGEISFDEFESQEAALEARIKQIEEQGPTEIKTEPKAKEGAKPVTEAGKAASEKVQKIYEEKGVDGSFEIIQEFGGMVAGIVNKRENAPGFDRQLLTDEINTGKGGLIDLIRTYKPESGVPLAAYINKNLPLRAIAASERILETDFTKDIEGEGMRGIASDDVLPFESTSTAIEIAEEDARVADLIKPAEEFIADEVALNKAIDTIEEVTKDIPAKERTFAKIGVKKDDATLLAVLEPISEELNISVKKLSDKKTVFNRDDYKSARVWANENLDLILKLLPKGAIPPGGLTSKELQGSATNLPNNILQELYNKNPRFTKKNGLAPFILKRGLDKTDVLKAFGMDANGDLMVTVDASGRGRESKTLQGMINLMARLSANQLIREYGDVTVQEKQDIAAGKADIMFSKALVPTKEKADIVSALDSEAVKSVFGSTNKDVFESMASKIGDTPDLNYDKLRKIILESTKNTLSTRQRRTFERVLFEAATPDIETFNKIFAEYRKLFKYEQQIIGFSVAKSVLNKTFNAAKGKEAKTEAIAEWLKIVSRSIRTLGIDGNTTNEKIFNNILLKLIPNIKDYGFDLLTETKNGKKLTFITLGGNKLTGLADITEVKKDFKNNVERINEEAIEAQNFIISQIEELNTSEAIGFIALMTADQRGAVRKSSSAGFSVIGENISNLILEHETTALEIQQEYVKFAKGDISEKQLREFLAKAKVNLVTKEMDAALNSDKSIIGEARYEIPAFLELKNKANIDTNEDISPELTKSKEKAAEGNNKALPKDLQLEGEPTVQETIDNAEVIYDDGIQLQIKFSKKQSLNKTFNDIIENKTGIPSSREVSAARAKVRGDGKGRFKFFIPPTAEDFVGLLYTTLGKGKVGDTQMAWYKENLLDPYAAAMRNISAARISMMKNYNALVDKLDITPKDLAKKIPGSDFTREQAVRYHIWTKQGNTIPGINDSDKAELGEFMNKNPELQQFASTLIALTKNEGYAKPEKSWTTGTITTDLLEVLNTDTRVKYLQVWQNNVDEIFSSNNLNKLEAAFGSNYRDALENSLDRMESGRNRSPNMDRLTGRFMDYLNASTAVIMFFNTRSAILQTISSINFINWSDNNPIAAGKAFANQKQYWKDFKYLFNSDYLVDRRGGLKMEVEEAEIANLAKKDGPKAVIARLLQLGFTPTQIADSFAISTGGATFYRNRINSLMKADDTLSQAEAEQIAFDDFREAAEDSQQSSRPDKISQQQAGPLGRIILAFANTPAQYARLTKKAILDLKNGRGDAKTNISKIVYYMAVQNLIFTALQQALIGLAFDDEDEEGLTTDKTINVANSMLDSILRGIGIAGAVVSTIKNVGLKIYRESEKDRPKYSNVADELLKISPPISSKYGKIKSVGRAFEWDKDKMETMGFDIQNPAYLAAGNTVAAVGNIPLDRLIRKAQNVEAAITEDMHAYQRIGLVLGWDKWSLGLTKKEQEAEKKAKKNRSIKFFSKGGKKIGSKGIKVTTKRIK